MYLILLFSHFSVNVKKRKVHVIKGNEMIHLDLRVPRTLAAASAHYYKEPTEERYIDRVLEHHDLIFMVEGGWSMTELNREYMLAKNDVLLLASGRHHYNRLPCSPGTKTFCLHVTATPGDRQDNPFSVSLPTHIHIRHPQQIQQYFSSLVATYWSVEPFKEQKIEALLTLLLLALHSECREQQESKEDLAERAIRIINDTPHHRYKTKEMADLLFVSPKTLNNAMNKKVGMPFYAYEKQQKLNMVAVQLKLEPDWKLSQIASAFGFYDEFHMSKAFKQKFGLSPSEYRSAAQVDSGENNPLP